MHRQREERENVLAAIKTVRTSMKSRPGNGARAPQYAHDMVDAMISAKAAETHKSGADFDGARGWAHAVLDRLWDLY